jgi:hypothetical protein
MTEHFQERRIPDKFARGARGGLGFSTEVTGLENANEVRNVNFAEDRGEWDISHLVQFPKPMAALKAFHATKRGRAIGFRLKWWEDYQGIDQLIGIGDGATTSFQLRKNYADNLAGTAQSGGASTITLQAVHDDFILHDQSDIYNGTTIRIVGGTGAGQLRVISDYVGGSKAASVLPAWSTAPDATSQYEIELFVYRKTIVKPVPGTVSLWINDATASAFSVDHATGLITGVTPTPATNDVVWSPSFEFDFPVRFNVDVQQIEFTSVNSRNWRGLKLIEVLDS